MEVFSFGNGDFLFQIFSAIVGMMGDGSFTTLIRIAIILGFLFLAYQLLFSMNITNISVGMVKHYIFIVVIIGIMFTPKTNIIIRDEIKNTQVIVNNVPYGVGLFAHIFTTVERGLTKIMENYFSTPADMRFNKSGYAFSVMLLDSFKDATPKDIYFKQTLDGYIESCFFHDVLWGDKDLQQVIFANNLWSQLAPNNSANKYAKIYNQANPAGEGSTCNATYAFLSGRLGTISSEALTTLNSVMQVDVVARTPAITQYLLGISMSANDAITQAVASNAIKSSFARTAMHTGEGAGAIPYASGLAEQTQRSSWTVAGDLSKKYIPILRQILEAFVYGLFPLLFIMMLTPLGGRYFSLYITLLTWLLLWSPLFAIINLIVNVRANGVMSASYGYFSIGSMPYIYQSASELTAMAGYMAWMVPTVAFAIAKGSEYAITSLASGVASSVGFTSKSAASTISSPDSAPRIAAHAGLVESTQTYGSMAMQGVAAKQIFSIQGGMAARQTGMAGTGQIANTEMSARHMDAKQLEEISKKHGMTVPQAQGVIAGDKYQRAITEAGARKSFAEDFAKQRNATTEAGYQFLAETQIASNRAINEAWGGNVGAYTNFLKTGYELSAGQQKGLVAAASAAGVNIRDYGEMATFMEEMKKVGAMDKLRSGEISAEDLRNMGAMGLLSEKGMADAAQRMSAALGISYDQAKANLLTREGLNQYAKVEMRTKANELLGGDSSDKSYYNYVQGVHASDSKTLTQTEAQNLEKAMKSQGYANFSAKGGDKATFAFNPTTGKFTMAHTARGGRSETYDVGAIDKGKRHRIGDDIKTGNNIQRVDINNSTLDHTNTQRTGTDIQHLNVNTAKVDIGTQVGTTAFQMALSGNQALTMGAANPNLTNAQREAEIMAVAGPLARQIGELYQQAGRNTNFAKTDASASVGVGTPSVSPYKASIVARGAVGVQSEERFDYNLVTKEIASTLRETFREAQKQKLSHDQTSQLMADRLQKYTQNINDHVMGKTTGDFGVSKPGKFMTDVGKTGLPYPYDKEEKLQQGQKLAERWKGK